MALVFPPTYMPHFSSSVLFPSTIPYLLDLSFSIFFFSAVFTSIQLIIFISPLSFFTCFSCLVSSSSFFFISSTVNSLSLSCPSKHQFCMYLYSQSGIVLCCSDTTFLPLFLVQRLSLTLKCIFFFFGNLRAGFFFWG